MFFWLYIKEKSCRCRERRVHYEEKNYDNSYDDYDGYDDWM